MREPIIIIGGGLTGTISAALLSKLRDDHGEPLYDIVLLEEKQNILDGASITIDRLHLGGEYPLDQETAFDCLKGALIFKQMLPDFFADLLPTSYLISEETNNKGELCLEQYIEHYQNLQKRYKKYFQKACASYGEQRTAETLFGYPEDFFSVLVDISHVKGFAGGIKTKEKSLNPVLLGSFLEKFLRKQGVRIYPNHKVIDAFTTGTGFNVVVNVNNNERVMFTGSQVVNAAWHNALALNHLIEPISSNSDKLYAHLRGLAVIDISACKRKPEAIFGMLGERGGAYSPMNDKIAFLYLPHEVGSYLGNIEQNNQTPSLPKSWEEAINNGPPDIQFRKESILNILTSRYPFLEGAKILNLIVRPTLSLSEVLEERRHFRVRKIDPKGNWLCALSMKATFAPMAAIEVLKCVQSTSLKNGKIRKHHLIPTPKTSDIILPSALSLSDSILNEPDFFKYAREFAEKRGLPPAIVTKKESYIESHFPPLSEYTEPLRFIIIHTGNTIDSGISFNGTHIHAVKEKLIAKNKYNGTSKHNIPPYTIIQHGTMDDLHNGKFDTGIKEEDRLNKIGGDAGIASRAIIEQVRVLLNDEAVIINGQSFFGDYSGKAEQLKGTDTYSFLQLFSLEGAKEISLTQACDTETIVKSIQETIFETDSFAACFTGRLLKRTSLSKLIRGSNPDSQHFHQTVKETWKDQKELSGHYQPDVSHVIKFESDYMAKLAGLIIVSPIKSIPVKQFLLADQIGRASCRERVSSPV